MEDEVIKALESLYSQGKTEDEIVAASIEAGYEDQVDKVKEFFKKKSSTELAPTPSESGDGLSPFATSAPVFDPLIGPKYIGVQGLAQPLRSGAKKNDAWFIVDEQPNEVSRLFNRATAQGMIGNLITGAEVGVAPDWEDLAYYNRVLRDNAVSEEDVLYSDGAITGFIADAIRVIPESFISMGTAAPAGLAGAGAGATAGSAFGPGGAAVGGFAGFAGGTSLAIEYGNSIMQSLQEAGVNIYDGQALLDAQSNPEIMGAARSYAVKRGVPVAIFDAASGGSAGKVAKALLKSGAKRSAAIAAEAGVQGALGGGGEIAGSLTAGEDINWRDVALEAVAEIAPATPGATYEYFKQKAEIPEEVRIIEYQQNNPDTAPDVINAAHLRSYENLTAIDDEINSLKTALSTAGLGSRKPINDQIKKLRTEKYKTLNSEIEYIDALSDEEKAQAVSLTNEIISLRNDAQTAQDPKVKKALENAIDKKYIELQTFYYDSEKKAGIPSPVEAGQAPVPTEPVAVPSPEAPEAGRDVQAPEEVTEESFKVFVDTGEVSPGVLTLISDKIVNSVPLNIQEQAIYKDKAPIIEEQIKSRETIVEKPAEAVIPEATPQEVESIKDSIVFTRGQHVAGAAPESAIRTFNRALGALYNVNPDVKLVIHQNQKSLTDSHQDATNLTEGYYSAADNTIHILATDLKKGITDNESRVLRHEIIHPILNAEFTNEPRLRSKFVSQIQDIISDSLVAQSAEAEKVRQTFSKLGEVEGITEFLAQFTNEDAFRAIESNPSLLDKLKRFLNKLIKRIFPNTRYQLETSQDTYEFLSRMRDSFETGQAFKTASKTTQATATSKIQASTQITQGEVQENFGKNGMFPIDDVVRFEDGVPVGVSNEFKNATPMFESLSEKLGIPFVYVNTPGAGYISRLGSIRESGMDFVSFEKQLLNRDTVSNALTDNGYKVGLPDGQDFFVVINTGAINPEAPIRSFAAYFTGLIKPTKAFRKLVERAVGKEIETPQNIEDMFVADVQANVAELTANQPRLDRDDTLAKAIVSSIENILRMQAGLDVNSPTYQEVNNIPVIQEMKKTTNDLVNEGIKNTPYYIDDVELGGSLSALTHFMLSGDSVVPYSRILLEGTPDITDRAQAFLDFLVQNAEGNKELADIYEEFYGEIVEIGEENVFDTMLLASGLDVRELGTLKSMMGGQKKFVPFYIDIEQSGADPVVLDEVQERFKMLAGLLADMEEAGGSLKAKAYLQDLLQKPSPEKDLFKAFVSFTRPELGDIEKSNPNFWGDLGFVFFSDLKSSVFDALKGDFYRLSYMGKTIKGYPKGDAILNPYVDETATVPNAEIADAEVRKMLIDPAADIVKAIGGGDKQYADFLAKVKKAVNGARTKSELSKVINRAKEEAVKQFSVAAPKDVSVSENDVIVEIPATWTFPDAEEANGFKVRPDVRGKTMDDTYTVTFSYNPERKFLDISFKTKFFDFNNVPQYLKPNDYFSKIIDIVPYVFSDRPIDLFSFAAVEEDHLDGFEPTTKAVRPANERRAMLYNLTYRRAYDSSFDMRSKDDLSILVNGFGVYTLPVKGEAGKTYFYFKDAVERAEDDFASDAKAYNKRIKELIKEFNPTKIEARLDLKEGRENWQLENFEKDILKDQVSEYNTDSKWGEQLPVPKLYSAATPMDAFAQVPEIEQSKKIVVDKKKFKPIKDIRIAALENVKESEEALYKARNANRKRMSDLLKDRKVWWDRQADIRKLMQEGQLEYVEAVMDSKQGAMANANKQFANIENKIYSDLSTGDVELLDAIVYARRVIQIDNNFDSRKAILDVKISEVESKMKSIEGQLFKETDEAKRQTLTASYESLSELLADLQGQKKERPKHAKPSYFKGNYNKEAAETDLDAMRLKYGDAKFNEINQKASDYFKEFNNIWLESFEAGLISEEEYNRFKNDDYAPRIFLRRILDEDVSFAEEVMPKGLKESQIKAIAEGSEGLILTDSKMLMSMAIKSLNYRRFENVANKALADDAITPNNSSWVREANYQRDEDGNIIKDEFGNYKVKPADDGFRNVYYREAGRLRALQLENDSYVQWNDIRKSYFNLSSDLKGVIRKYSGSNILRTFATGINPTFAIMNAPAELGSVLLGRGVYDSYKFLPVSMYKLATDYTRGLIASYKGYKDSQLLRDAFKYGIGMTFMSNEGRPELAAKRKYQGTLEFLKGKAARGILGLSWLGEATEIGLRLAVFQQARRDLAKKYPEYDADRIGYMAAAEARRISDFAAGGTLIKDLDNAVPYLNAAAQGFRANASYVKKNPGAFLSKMVQAGLGVMALSILNEFMGGDDDEQDNIPPYIRQRYFIVMTPFEDKDGVRQYIRVKKPQTFTGPIMAFQMLGESTGHYIKTGEAKKFDEADIEMAYDSFTDAYPFFIPMMDEFQKLGNRTPLINSALKVFANYDAFRQRVISPDKGEVPIYMEGYGNDKIEYFYKALGEATNELPTSLQVSPSGTKAVVETFITSPTNNIATNLAYSILDQAFSVVDVQDPTAQKKQLIDFFGQAFTNAKGAAIKSVDPNWRTYSKTSDVKQIMMEAEGLDKKIRVQLRELAKPYKGKKLSRVPNEVVNYIESLDESQRRSAVSKFARYAAASDVDAKFYDVRFAPTPQAQAKLFLYHFGTPQAGTEEYNEVMKGLEAVGFVPTRNFKLALQEELRRQ